MKRRYATPAQTHLVHTHPYGTDPALPGLQGHPNVIIETLRSRVVAKEGCVNINADLDVGPAGVSPATGSFTVADNDFTTGAAILTLGLHQLISNIDFIPGVTEVLTAAAIVTAINRLQGFTAIANGALVMVTWGGSLDEVEFYAIHYGTKVNFTPFVPDNGYFAMGRPFVTAPELTP